MPNNPTDLPVSTESAVEDGYRRLLQGGQEAEFGVAPRPAPLTRLARELADAGSLLRTIPALAPGLYQGGFITPNREYRVGESVVFRESEWRAVEAAGIGTRSNAISEHRQLSLTEGDRREDRVHAEVVTRWATSNMSDAERDHMGASCPCASCTRGHYEEVQRVVGSEPSGYTPTCVCERCMGWRRAMALGIQDLILGRVPERYETPTFNITINEVRQSLDFDGAELEALMADVTIEPPRVADSVSRFAQARAERGHPLPKQALPADWQPNYWEA